ncbi:MAG: PepSY domain-containing protein, partial [Sciscionella sp.]
LWLVLPAVLFITAGAVEGLIEPLESLLGAARDPPAIQPAASSVRHTISPSRAIAIAVARHPGSALSVLGMPTAQRPWYRIRVLEPGEPRRAFGTTVVYVGALKGDVLADFDALKEPRATRALADAYPLHTGEFFGLPGRIMSLVDGLWLMAMALFGAQLWWTRRRQRAAGAIRAAPRN